MKNKIKVLFGILFFCGVLTWGLGVSADTIFTDDFNSYVDGDLSGQGGWRGSANLMKVQSDVVLEGGKAVIADSNFIVTFIKDGTPQLDGKITVHVKRSEFGRGGFRLLGDVSYGVDVRFFPQSNAVGGGTFIYRDSNNNNQVFAVSGADIWYALQIEWRSAPDHKVRYRVDDGGWTDWVNPLTDWGTGLGSVGLFSEGPTVYFDKIEESLAGETKTPVLIVPGLMGTDIKKGDELLWADLDKMFGNIGDNFLDSLSFNSTLESSDPSLSLSDIIKFKTLAGAKVFNYTENIIGEFTNQGYIENETLFMFPYDWRYGVTGVYVNGKTNVDLLGERIATILAQTGSEKVDIIAHSMGGLIVKKHVVDNFAGHDVGKAVFVGVPNTGAPKSVKVLLQGDNFDVLGLSDAEIKKISENFPAAYDLLPSQKYYDVKGSYVKVVDNGSLGVGPVTIKELNYGEVKSFLTSDHSLNSTAMATAEGLHTQAFDDFDMRTAGVDVYAVDGCTTPTITNIVESRAINIFGQKIVDYKALKWGPGDKTVPLESSTNLPINQENKFYSLNASHGTMMTQDGSRQQIVNIIAGSSLAVDGNMITQDISECKLNGKAISVFSPVDIFVTDQDGNEMGLASDGSIFNEIPNADFQVWGEHKFLYLPTDGGQVYDIKMDGTGSGTYTIKIDDIENNEVVKTQVFSNLPVTADLTGTVNLGTAGAQDSLTVKQTATSQPETIFSDLPDTVAPEAIIEFDPVAKDLKFSAIEPGVTVADANGVVTLTDQAGNVTEITMKEKDRRKSMSAEIKSLKYNGVKADISKNIMQFKWSVNKKSSLEKLFQHVKAKKDYNVNADFDGKNTKVEDKDANGKIKKTFSGLKIIKVTTNKGYFEWGY